MNQPDHNLTPEQAKAAAAAYQEQVMRHLFGFLTLTGNGPTTSSTSSPTTNEKETDHDLN